VWQLALIVLNLKMISSDKNALAYYERYNKRLVDKIRSSLLPTTIHKNKETLQLFTINNKTEGVYKPF
jgi:hypothetical protein